MMIFMLAPLRCSPQPGLRLRRSTTALYSAPHNQHRAAHIEPQQHHHNRGQWSRTARNNCKILHIIRKGQGQDHPRRQGDAHPGSHFLQRPPLSPCQHIQHRQHQEHHHAQNDKPQIAPQVDEPRRQLDEAGEKLQRRRPTVTSSSVSPMVRISHTVNSRIPS